MGTDADETSGAHFDGLNGHEFGFCHARARGGSAGRRRRF
jgi:hypothetical protein